MKDVGWEECIAPSSSGTYQKSGCNKMIFPLDPVARDMHVSARYDGVDVHLRILDASDQQRLTAEVLYFEPVLKDKPRDLCKGDIVMIDHRHICCLHNK